MSRKMRQYLSCYSCDHSTILMDENGKKMVHCGLSDRYCRITKGMAFPEWCEVAKAIRRAKETE